MKAAILAGGPGSRLYPITYYVPKCMIPIGGRPFLDYVIEYLKKHRVEEIVLLLSKDDYEVFQNHYGNGEKLDVRISYSVAPRIGTAGALYAARKEFNETFIVYYGDVLTDFNMTEMIRFHKRKHASCTVALTKSVPIDYGIGKMDASGRLISFQEKPILEEYPVSMAIYIFEPEILKYCKPNRDIASDVIPTLIEKKLPIYGYVTDRPHHDIGSFKHLDMVKEILSEKEKRGSSFRKAMISSR